VLDDRLEESAVGALVHAEATRGLPHVAVEHDRRAVVQRMCRLQGRLDPVELKVDLAEER
jgi:hypothetical protein